MQKNLLIVCLGLTMALAGCGGEETKKTTPPEEKKGSSETTTPEPAKMSSLMGVIKFEGPVPAAKPLSTKADPKCPQGGDMKSEEVVVSDGGLENVIVYISSGAKEGMAPPAEAKVIDQNGCHYVPHVFTVQVGQEVKIKNSDDTGHNIHTLSDKNPQKNIAQQGKGVENSEKFTMVETFKVKCDVHPWMGAVIGVFDHPYHTVSGKGGAFEIKLPPGKYEVTAVHEKYGKQKAEIEVKEGMTHLPDFIFKDAKSGN